MRCVALAQGFHALGCSITFLTNAAAGASLAQRQDCPFDIRVIDPTNLQATEALLTQLMPDILVADGYHFTVPALQRLYRFCALAVFVDDVIHPGVGVCDVVLNTSPVVQASDYAAFVPSSSIQLLGTRYCLLRPEFERVILTDMPDRKKLVISFGGSDPAGYTYPLLAGVLQSPLANVPVLILAGAYYASVDALHDLARMLPHCEVLINCQTMSAALGEARMAISAAGSTAFELAATGTPGLLVSVAENQIRLGEFFAQQGCSLHWRGNDPNDREVIVDTALQAACRLWNDDDQLQQMQRAALRLGLANGAKIAAQQLLDILRQRNDAKTLS